MLLSVSTLRAEPSEDASLAVLQSSAPADQKCNACRDLKMTGTEKSIPVLAGLLANSETSHAARIALESLPYPAAGAALRDAAAKATGLAKAGILDSLGVRRDGEAVPLAAAALGDGDSQVVAAAAMSLGKIGTSAAAAALAEARAKAQGEARLMIAEASVLCADRLLAAGKCDEAAKIYRELSQPAEPRQVRAGALRGVFDTAGPQKVALIRQSLAGDDPVVHAAAAAALSGLSGDALRQVADSAISLPADSLRAILMAIRLRGDRSLTPLALAAAKSADETIRLAAIAALGAAGDASALPLLIDAVDAGDKARDAAWKSLAAISGPGVDEGIVAAMRTTNDPGRRTEWIGLLETRRPAGMVPVLLGEVSHPAEAVRSRASAALAKFAGPQDVAAIVALVLKSEKGGQRDELERTVVLACQQISDSQKRADPVLAVLQSASPADRMELLPLLGRLGGGAARTMIQEAVGSKDAETHAAGIRALCNWPDATVAAPLLQLAKSADDETHRLWALRAYIRVISLPGETPDAERLAGLRQADSLAVRDEDRSLILDRAAAVRTVESLRFVLPYLDRPALAETAAKSIVELARHKELREPNRAEFAPALEKVIATSKNSDTVEKAKRHLAGS